MSSDVPGYFVGRPMNYAEPAQEQQAADEQQPAASTQIPGDYFVGRPGNQQQTPPPAPAPAPARPSFLAKLYSNLFLLFFFLILR
uniref:Uncharacterized protein n=1 Tax=Oryza brachyantha TaxID=4533 RepID=J3N704_ORYBR